MEVIRSTHNPAILRARSVGAGKEKGFLLLEGERLVADALRRGLLLELCLVAADREDTARELERAGASVRLVEPKVLARASRLVAPPGVVAVGATPAPLDLERLEARAAPLVLVACGAGDPGNLGALARTAEAAGAGALVLIGGASPWSPKALRGSMGSLLRLPVALADSAGAVRAALDARGYHQVRAAARGGADFARFAWRAPLALWMASETGDLPADAQGFDAVTIPLRGAAESLNVAAAAAVLLFAARAAPMRADCPRPMGALGEAQRRPEGRG